MKKLLFILTSCIIFCIRVYPYQDDTTTIVLLQSNYESGESPEKGHRIPSKPQFCVINYAARTIETSLNGNIDSYTLLTDTGEVIISSTSIAFDIVNYLASNDGYYILRIITDERVYCGYVEL